MGVGYVALDESGVLGVLLLPRIESLVRLLAFHPGDVGSDFQYQLWTNRALEINPRAVQPDIHDL